MTDKRAVRNKEIKNFSFNSKATFLSLCIFHLMNRVHQVASMFNKLPSGAKLSISVCAGGAAAYAVANFFFAPYKTKGLPNAKNLNGFAPTLDRQEAVKILNLPKSFTQADIQRQHRVMMGLLHPDKGGSSYIATKINESRDFLALGTK